MESIKTAGFFTLGCKVNQYETEALMEQFAKQHYQINDFEAYCDVYIINTCTVTNFGDKKSRQIIRRAKKQNPNAIIVVMGCYAQVSVSEISKISEVNIIIGTKDRNKIVELVENYKPEDGLVCHVSALSKKESFEKLSVKKLNNRTRAYLKIQDGCNQFCSYCIIPYARGPIRSRNPEDVIAEVEGLSKSGYKEIVLAGIHVASYGKDLESIDLLDLIKMLHNVSGIERIRFSSIEPKIITTDFVESLKQLHKICHHFHLSLQSGCDEILKKMNRKYNTQEFADAVSLLRNAFPDVSITTDIIVGFPSETEDNFLETYDFLNHIKLSKLHIFPYSPKKGTPAATFNDQVPSEIKDARTKKMLLLNDSLSTSYLEGFVGKTVEVLFEKKEQDFFIGHASNYIVVKCPSDVDVTNQIVKVFIHKIENDFAFGEILFA